MIIGSILCSFFFSGYPFETPETQLPAKGFIASSCIESRQDDLTEPHVIMYLEAPTMMIPRDDCLQMRLFEVDVLEEKEQLYRKDDAFAPRTGPLHKYISMVSIINVCGHGEDLYLDSCYEPGCEGRVKHTRW